MKKRTLLALAVAMSVTAVAAANPFSDVPARHWAYDSVEKLTKAGVVDGYEDGTFRGERTMTRYEMAQIIARALAKVPTSTGGGNDAALKAELDKLSVEFAKELKNLGVRVTALENQKNNVKFSGDFRLRYDNGESYKKDGVKETAWTEPSQKARFRLQAEGKVNDNWSVVGRFVANDNLRQNDNNKTDVTMDKMYANGQYGDFGVKLGKFDVLPAYGIFYDDYMKGAEVSWNSDKFYAAGRYGRLHEDVSTTKVNRKAGEILVEGDTVTYMGEIGVKNVVKGLNLRAMYAQVETSNNSGGVWEAGADYTLGNSGFKLTAAVADTTGDMNAINTIWSTNGVVNKVKKSDDTAWFAQADYKGAKKSEKGSWGAFAGYRDFQNSSAPQVTTFNTNGKGWYVGGSYAPATNVVLKAWYENMKAPVSPLKGSGEKNSSRDYIRAQAEFFF